VCHRSYTRADWRVTRNTRLESSIVVLCSQLGRPRWKGTTSAICAVLPHCIAAHPYLLSIQLVSPISVPLTADGFLVVVLLSRVQRKELLVFGENQRRLSLPHHDHPHPRPSPLLLLPLYFLTPSLQLCPARFRIPPDVSLSLISVRFGPTSSSRLWSCWYCCGMQLTKSSCRVVHSPPPCLRRDGRGGAPLTNGAMLAVTSSQHDSGQLQDRLSMHADLFCQQPLSSSSVRGTTDQTSSRASLRRTLNQRNTLHQPAVGMPSGEIDTSTRHRTAPGDAASPSAEFTCPRRHSSTALTPPAVSEPGFSLDRPPSAPRLCSLISFRTPLPLALPPSACSLPAQCSSLSSETLNALLLVPPLLSDASHPDWRHVRFYMR
jgi:hypothetical protein